MCKVSFGLVFGTIASFLLLVGAATADPYKWCAQYTGDGDGGRNCGFVTIEQCRATISRMGGFCEPNLFYTGPEEKAVSHVRKRQDRN